MSAMTTEQAEALNGLRSAVEELRRAAQPLTATVDTMVHFEDEELRPSRLESWYKDVSGRMTACRAAMTAASKAKKALAASLAPPPKEPAAKKKA